MKECDKIWMYDFDKRGYVYAYKFMNFHHGMRIFFQKNDVIDYIDRIKNNTSNGVSIGFEYKVDICARVK